MAFLPVNGDELLSPDGASKENPAEAGWVAKILENLLQAGDLEETDIGIITPYAGQVRAIRDALPERNDSVEVHTVDGYQGGKRRSSSSPAYARIRMELLDSSQMQDV